MTTETTTADAWLHKVLTADLTLAGLGVYDEVGPEGAAYPFVVFQYQGSSDLTGTGSRRWGVNATYVVKAVGNAPTYNPLRPVAAAIDRALHRASGIVVGEGEIWGCVREAPFRLTDPDGFRHLGGFYRLWLTQTG